MAGKNKKKARLWKARAKELRRALARLGAGASAPEVSPLAPKGPLTLPPIAGAEFASVAAGVRYAGRDDVMLARLAPGSTVAGVFTRSATRSAAVLDCQAKLAGPADTQAGAAILVNSGNANAFTGRHGQEAVDALGAAVSGRLAVPVERVFTASTGVIGEPLPHGRIAEAIDELSARLSPDGLPDAARAIMTTDTFAKGASAETRVGEVPVHIAGIAKGSGMIAPDMATMLVYIFTDASVAAEPLQEMVRRQADLSFNCITVDSDTSTSDTVMVAATGRSEAPEITDMRSSGAQAFEAALGRVMLDLAHQVVRDGEGASKFVEIAVTGAASDSDAHRVGMAIANSPLVKTAIAGEDPNWGRVVMAVGKSGAAADRDRLSIDFGNIRVAENGWVAPSYDEAEAAAYMKRQELTISVDLGIGTGCATVWTCDLTHRYIDINADYRS
ncbi:bifunctional ornithine acetyltransferase/N-acetylglutamate synthase [Rhodobacteraceae bacterium WD3A24]|nr:bifunctional ornithine acetyltransferase/N-acetylglutamate synthase [Rhodobacteraceae bacterium WD3A24]